MATPYFVPENQQATTKQTQSMFESSLFRYPFTLREWTHASLSLAFRTYYRSHALKHTHF